MCVASYFQCIAENGTGGALISGENTGEHTEGSGVQATHGPATSD